jgi:uncharacterized membrane protein YfhO
MFSIDMTWVMVIVLVLVAAFTLSHLQKKRIQSDNTFIERKIRERSEREIQDLKNKINQLERR